MDEHAIDQHLGVVLDGVLDVLYQAKQTAWAASTSPARPALRELVSFLIDQSGLLMQAEERIDGRAPGIATPSAHQRGNIVADHQGDIAAATAAVVERLDEVTADARARAATMPGAEEGPMLMGLADGLATHAAALRR